VNRTDICYSCQSRYNCSPYCYSSIYPKVYQDNDRLGRTDFEIVRAHYNLPS